MKVLFFQLFFFSATLIGLGQPLSFPKLPPDELQQDFDVFKKVLLSTHPQPYRFLRPADFQKLIEDKEQLLTDSLSQIDFFQLVSSVMSHIGEGHSNVGISEKIIKSMEDYGRLLPIELHFSEGNAFISNDESSFQSALEGFQVLSINGMDISSIIDQIDSISCLGTAVNRSMVYRKLSLMKNFPLAYFLFVDQSASYELVLKDRKGGIKTVEVAGNPIDFKVSFTQERNEVYPPFSLNIDTTRSLATIKIFSFAHWVVNLKFKDYLKFYKLAFEAIETEGIDYLIIDVRDNRGGHEYLGAQLLSYLMDEPFYLETSMLSRKIKFPLLDSLKIKYDGLRKKAYQKIDSGYLVKESIVLKEQRPSKKYRFDGNVFFLMNGNCFSACNIFMALADFHELGTIIGEESGGIYQDTDGYFRVDFNLPNSGLHITFPLWHIKTAVEREDYGRGVFPDIYLDPTIEDVLGRKDPMIEKVYDLINNKPTDL